MVCYTSRMDASTIGYVSYRYHRICNPFSFGQLERTLAFTDLKEGDKAVDLGCGNAVVSVWMAERYGLELTGVERFGPVADQARAEAAKPHARGSVTIVEGQAREHLATAGQHRVVSVIGAVDLFEDLKRPAEVMAALVPAIAPGGWLLWGDPFWKKPPSETLAAVFGAERYASLAGWLEAGEAAGLSPRYTAISTDADWEEYLWRMNASVEDWVAENADSPAAPMLKMRAAMLRRLHVNEGHESLGFGLYLFRRPPLQAT